MLTKYCTVEQKNGKALKPMQIATKNEHHTSAKTKNLLKPMHLCTKAKRKDARNNTAHTDTHTREAQR
jgi:hypothetical protein